MTVIGIDPGTKGYQCRLTLPGPRVEFWPAFYGLPEQVGQVLEGLRADDKNEAFSRYDLVAMVSWCRAMMEEGEGPLVVIEAQAPQRRGKGKFGSGKEGTLSSWKNGFGFGAWQTALVAAGFREAGPADFNGRGEIRSIDRFVIAEPLRWKAAMGATVQHYPGQSKGRAKRENDLKTILVAKRLYPGVDMRAVERVAEPRSDCADKAAALLLADWGLRRVLGVAREVTSG